MQLRDSSNMDAFSRLRISQPIGLFESRFRNDLAPLQYEQITSSGAVAHDATDSNALLSISAATGLAAMQSFRFIRYQPGKSQQVAITFVLGTAAANVTRRVGLFNATNSGATVTIENGVFLEQTGAATINLRIVNAGTQADQIVAKGSWNIDPMTGTGPSGKTLDLTKAQILIIDLQWLGTGRVRVGFDIDGQIFYVHQFLNANSITDVYMQSATLPIRFELTTAASATADMKPICASVITEGGSEDPDGYQFATEFSGTAGNGSQVHLGSFRPFLTFNSIVVRYPIIPIAIETIVTGNNPVLFEVVYGATFSAGPTWAGGAFSTYSGAEITTVAGTIATSPIVGTSWYTPASNQNRGSQARQISALYPLTLDANAANRAFGTLSIYATGIGAASACRASLQWKELR